MDAAVESAKKKRKRRALKRAKAELEARLAEVGSRLEDATARATALEARNADLAAKLAAANAKWDVQRRGFEHELHFLGEDLGNALADPAGAQLQAEEATQPAIDRLTAERGQLAVELSQTREALAAALAEVEQLNSHVAQLRAALDDTSRDQAEVAPLREEIGIALAARAAAELRFEEAASERDLLRARVAELEGAHAERETLRVAVAGLQERLLQSSTEMTEAVLEHNRQMADWYAERGTLSAQQARLAAEAAAAQDTLAAERASLGAEIARMQGELARAAAAADADGAELAALGGLAAARENEIAALTATAANLGAKQEQWRRFLDGAAALVDVDAAQIDDPLDLLERTRRRLREIEMALDRAEVERERLGADLAARIAAAEARPLRKLQRFLRHLLPRRMPVPASSRS
jgi:chromosome segregation ATPase